MSEETYIIPYECRSLQISIDPEEWLHAPDHPDFDPTKPSACEMKRRLKGVRLRTVADNVLSDFPNTLWVKPAKAYQDKRSTNTKAPDLIVEWYYEGFTLILERAMYQSPVYGNISAYAVQRIEPNTLKRKLGKPKKFKRVSK